MRITFLGSGGAFCDYRVNYHNNALVWTAEGPVLLDCGTTAVQSMRELGVAASEVRAVVLTHLHADHASPEQLVFERFYGGPPDAPAFRRTEIVGPEDLVDPLLGALEPFLDIFTDRRHEARRGGVAAMVEARRAAEVEIGGVRFRWFRVPHVRGPRADKPAYGIEIDDGRSRVVWSGDTTFSPAWIERVAGDARVDRLFHECTFLPPHRGTVHTHFVELDALPEELKGRITLMHHTAVPEGTDVSAFAGAARRHEEFSFGEGGEGVAGASTLGKSKTTLHHR